MQCPLDQTTLVMSERKGIEIDYCPTCRGVWLDRGELDKLIAGSEQHMPAHSEPRGDYQHDSHQGYKPQYSDDSYKHHKKHKKESFLGDLFDF